MKNLRIEIGSGDALDIRQFSVRERLSALFQVSIVAVSENPSIDFDAVLGQAARFAIQAGLHQRFWAGICSHFELLRAEPAGLSTYRFSIVPTMWLLTQRKNYRMFQHISEPDIVLKVLSEWGIEPERRIDAGAYKKRKYRVQYAESDFAFVNRMLEEAGITYHFAQDGEETRLVLADAPQSNARRGMPLRFLDDASMVQNVDIEYVTSVHVHQQVRPGKYAMRDHDYRKPPTYKLMSTATKGLAVEEKLERFQYTPGAFLFGSDSGEATPVADDRGKARTDEKEAAVLAQKRLDAKRGKGWGCTFETNAYDLAPGVVLSLMGHPHTALGEGKALLVVESSLEGTAQGEWSLRCEARKADQAFRPEQTTPKPKVSGVESATVVGPAGEEIHTDEFGRVRVHFHWDRESGMDEKSSCWIHVSQSWGGAGYGGTNLPRIGQEVLVDFLGGDPDRPVIVGRVYTNLQKTPYKLPENKTQSGWKSNSTGGGGGYNEIMFEDAVGKELVRMQAEKDLKTLVKNDEQVTIGHDRLKSVGHDETQTVGNNRTRLVGNNESLTIGSDSNRVVGGSEHHVVGNNRVVSIGINRSTQVGLIDSTLVGDTHVVNIAPPGEGGSSGASSFMQGNRIVFDTGAGAAITLEGSTVTIVARGIDIFAVDAVNVMGVQHATVGGVMGLTLGAIGGEILIQGPMVNINP